MSTCAALKGFMDKVIKVAERFVSADAVHYESFDAIAQPDAAANTDLRVALDGVSYEISADRTIIEALDENGVEVDTSCQDDICRTSIVQCPRRHTEHRDNVLTKAEKESGNLIAVCVSRCLGKRRVLYYY